jgi:leucyl-tRNA synthetase
MTQEPTFTLVIQVNGKVRERLEVPSNISEGEVRELAVNNDKVATFIGENTIQKMIYVPGRLMNIVVRTS